VNPPFPRLSARFLKIACFALFWLVAPGAWPQQLMDMYENYTTKRIAASSDSENGNFKNALEGEQIALQAAQNKFGSLHPSIVPVLNDLAAIYRAMGRYPEAEKTYKWGLAIRENALGLGNPLVADSLNHLAALYGDLARDTEAEILEQRALQIMEKAKGGPNPECALEFLLLGKTQMNLGKFGEAEKTLELGLESEKGGTNPNPGLQLEILSALSQASRAAGHFDKAEARLLQCLEFCEKNFKADGVEMADALERLGDFFRAQGQKSKAQGYYESASKIYKQFTEISCTYPTVPYLLKTAAAYQAMGDDKTARKIREKVLATLRDCLGPDHPRVALCLAELAGDDLALGDKASAVNELKDAWEILKTSLGGQHPLTLNIQKRLQKLTGHNP
jgi:hypothetical protein